LLLVGMSAVRSSRPRVATVTPASRSVGTGSKSGNLPLGARERHRLPPGPISSAWAGDVGAGLRRQAPAREDRADWRRARGSGAAGGRSLWRGRHGELRAEPGDGMVEGGREPDSLEASRFLLAAPDLRIHDIARQGPLAPGASRAHQIARRRARGAPCRIVQCGHRASAGRGPDAPELGNRVQLSPRSSASRGERQRLRSTRAFSRRGMSVRTRSPRRGPIRH